MAQFYAVILPSSQAHHRWRISSLPRGTLHGVPFYWRGGRYVSDAVVEKHLIDALMDDPDVEVNMIAVASYPVVDATLVNISPEPVTPVEVPAVSEAWLEVDDELEPDLEPDIGSNSAYTKSSEKPDVEPDLGDEEEEKPTVKRRPGRPRKGE